jgi:hypothetical protein
LVALACCAWPNPASAQRRTDGPTRALDADTHDGFVPIAWDRVRVANADKTVLYDKLDRLTTGIGTVWNTYLRQPATDMLNRELAKPENLVPRATFQDIQVHLSRSGPLSMAVRPSKFGMKWTLPNNRIDCTLMQLPSSVSWASPRFTVTFDLDFIIWLKVAPETHRLTLDYSVAEVRNVRIQSQFSGDRGKVVGPGMARLVETKLNEIQFFDRVQVDRVLGDLQDAMWRIPFNRPVSVQFQTIPNGYGPGGIPQRIGVLTFWVGR